MTVASTKDSGSKTKWPESVFTSGRMVEHIRVSLVMIRDMAMEYMCGQMAGRTRVTGGKANNMVWVYMRFPMTTKTIY